MNRIGIAVIGAGRWGVHLVRNFLEHPDAQVVAVVDPNPKRLALCQERFNLNTNVVLATDWTAVCNHPEIQAVAIATPARTHYTLIADALRQGHHVLAEKPLTLDVAECIELCRLAEQQHRQLMVDHTYLFHPAVERGQEVIQSGRLGELRYGYAARTHLGPVRQDVNALWDLAIHDIAIFNTWLGQLPIEVQATGRMWLTPDRGREELKVSQLQVEEELKVNRLQVEQELKVNRLQVEGSNQFSKNQPSNLQPSNLQPSNLQPSNLQPSNLQPSNLQPSTLQGLADFVHVTVTYSTGFQAMIQLCWLNPDKQRRISVVGSRGTLVFDEMLESRPLTLEHGYLEYNGEEFTPVGQRQEVLDINRVEPLKIVCDRFLTSIRCAQPSPISCGWVATQLVHIVNCLEQSLQQGGHPITVPLLPNLKV